jgi:hypothetical protein
MTGLGRRPSRISDADVHDLRLVEANRKLAEARAWIEDARKELVLWELYTRHDVQSPRSAQRIGALIDRCPLPREEDA